MKNIYKDKFVNFEEIKTGDSSMIYNEALKFINNSKKLGMKPGLHSISKLLELMGSPHKKLKYIHIAGTNGKGSTASFIKSILIESGYKTGIFTSPYIQRITEQIKINDTEIEESQFAKISEFIKSKIEIMVKNGDCHPTEFEIITALAFQYFCEQNCDIVILEVGLGGRLDATNIIDTPELGIITAIGYDHINILGNTIQEIASEKAGIIKHGGSIVTYDNSQSVMEVIERACKENEAALYNTDFSSIKIIKQDIKGQVFDYKNHKSLEITLLGEHQIKNAVVAVDASYILKNRGYHITESTIHSGLLKARWPGRLEILKREPLLIIDGAHNLQGVKSLKESLDLMFPDKKLTFIIGVLADKDYKSMFEEILPGCMKILTVTPNNSRALPATDLALFCKKYCENVESCTTVQSALEKSLSKASKDDIICAFGSLYYIGEIRNCLGYKL